MLLFSRAAPSPQEELNAKVKQSCSSLMLLKQEMCAQPLQGLSHVTSHVSSSAPEVVKASHQLHSLALQYEGLNCEMSDAVAGLGAISSGSVKLRSMEERLSRLLQQLKRLKGPAPTSAGAPVASKRAA
ncbi:MAG: hypothetical protein WDW38_001149 [Sanguina aurantia]